MKSPFLPILITIWWASAPAAAAEGVADFSGLYRIAVEVPDMGDLKLDFIIKRNNETSLLRHSGQIELVLDEPSVQPLSFVLQSTPRTLGPETLPIGAVSVHFGSDEETYAVVLRLVNFSSWEDSGQRVTTKVIDGILTINEGPNDFATAIKLESFAVSKWDTTLRKFVPLKSL